jgi:hypothetical protein
MGHVSPSTQADNMDAPGERGRRSSLVGQTLIGSVLSGTRRAVTWACGRCPRWLGRGSFPSCFAELSVVI